MKYLFLLVFCCCLAGCSTTSTLKQDGPDALLQSAQFQIEQRNWILAERRAWAAAEIYSKNGDKKGVADCYYLIGKITRLSDSAQESLRRAIEHQTKAIALYQETNWLSGAAVAYADRGLLYFHVKEKANSLGDYRDALQCYQKAKGENPSFTLPIHNSNVATFEELIAISISEVEKSL